MIKEVAIDPEVMANPQHFRELWHDLGVSQGRLVAEYPSSWRDEVIKIAIQKSTTKAGRIMAELKPSPGNPRAKKWVATNRDYNRGLTWLLNAEKHEPPKAFDAIVAAANPRDKSRVLVAGEFPRDQPPWKTETNLEITRSSDELAKCARFLLSASDELVLVEPNFDAYKSRFRDSFAALARERQPKKPWKRCELHIKYPQNEDGKIDAVQLGDRMSSLKHYLPSLIPAGTMLKVFFWLRKADGKRLHPRFILTELGGLQPDHGLDEGTGEKDTTIISLLSESVWQTALADYCATSQTFAGGSDCVTEIIGIG